MTKASRRKERILSHQRQTENKMVRSLDKLAQYELFDKTIMPSLKKMIVQGWSPEKIRKHFAPLIQARMIQAGLGDVRSAQTMKAMKDLLDRHEGTAVQRVEQKNIYAKMSKKELAALALQKLQDANIINTTGRLVKEVNNEKETEEEEN